MKHYQIAMAFSALSLALVGCSVNANPPEKNIQPPAVIQQNIHEMEPTTANVSNNATPSTLNIKVSFEQAIQIAESHSKGQAVEVELQQGATSAIYDVETIAGTYEHRVQIDALTGQVLSSYSERELNVPPLAKVSLLQAIQIAQNNIKGKVISVSFDQEYINPEYEVKILADTGHPYELKIHGNTGAVMKSKVDYDHGDDD